MLLLAEGAYATNVSLGYLISGIPVACQAPRGILDFQFNPGQFSPVDPAAAILMGFSTDGIYVSGGHGHRRRGWIVAIDGNDR